MTCNALWMVTLFGEEDAGTAAGAGEEAVVTADDEEDDYAHGDDVSDNDVDNDDIGDENVNNDVGNNDIDRNGGSKGLMSGGGASNVTYARRSLMLTSPDFPQTVKHKTK